MASAPRSAPRWPVSPECLSTVLPPTPPTLCIGEGSLLCGRQRWVSAPTPRIRRPNPKSRSSSPRRILQWLPAISAYADAAGHTDCRSHRTFSPYFCVTGGNDAVHPQVLDQLSVMIGHVPHRNHGDPQLRVRPCNGPRRDPEHFSP